MLDVMGVCARSSNSSQFSSYLHAAGVIPSLIESRDQSKLVVLAVLPRRSLVHESSVVIVFLGNAITKKENLCCD